MDRLWWPRVAPRVAPHSEGFEFRIENEDGIARITGVAGFLIGAAALLAVGAHEFPVDAVGDPLGGFRQL